MESTGFSKPMDTCISYMQQCPTRKVCYASDEGKVPAVKRHKSAVGPVWFVIECRLPPVKYVGWYLVVRMGVLTAVSSVQTRAVQSPMERKYLEEKGLHV